ncbi:MAG: hypothetical protein R3250_18110, partial [Melioribacteraceae bacterium]|nr:hypothetical protein [Melioribacteraceae bacterium]
MYSIDYFQLAPTMTLDPKEYLNHFNEYGSYFFKIAEEDLEIFSPRDSEWLSKYGLPSNAIPFFFFDFLIQMLREITIPEAKYILGTAFGPASHHYLYVSQDDEVILRMK